MGLVLLLLKRRLMSTMKTTVFLKRLPLEILKKRNRDHSPEHGLLLQRTLKNNITRRGKQSTPSWPTQDDGGGG